VLLALLVHHGDLSILKSLGFTRRRVSATVVWQSSIIVTVGLVAAVPARVAGRTPVAAVFRSE